MSTDISPRVLHVHYADKGALYNAYMSFAKDGGLFIPGAFQAHLGTPFLVLVEIPGDDTLYHIAGKVVWINMNKRKGVGVRFPGDEYSLKLRNAIENSLGGMVKGTGATYTM